MSTADIPIIFADRRAQSLRTARKKLPWPRGKTFKILSLDGGGIRGIFTASLLAKIENDLTQGRPLAEFFDLIAGTSTGGILAVGIGLGVPATKMEHLYRVRGREVFPPPSALWRWAPNGLPSALRRMRRFAYQPEILRKYLTKEFGDRILGDSKARLLIPSFRATSPDIAVLKTDHHPDYRHDWKLLAWQAALATSAAPTYLPGFSSGDHVYLDGGVWANSPIMLAVVEALSAFEVERDQIKIFSIGTGNIAPEIKMSTAREGGLIAWRDIIHTAVYLTTDNAVAQSTLLIGPEGILRVQPPNEACGI